MNKRGMDLLAGEVISIILNVLFLTILIIFLVSKMSGSAIMEERYAKKIALALDYAKPGMVIQLDMSDAIKRARKEFGEDSFMEQMVQIEDNIVTVILKNGGKGYTYSFFPDVKLSAIQIIADKNSGGGFLQLVVSHYNEN